MVIDLTSVTISKDQTMIARCQISIDGGFGSMRLILEASRSNSHLFIRPYQSDVSHKLRDISDLYI